MFAATTDELATALRSELDDKVTDAGGSDFGCLWSNADIYRYMTMGCDALAKKTGYLYKTLNLPVVPDGAVVRLPSYVTNIRQARLVNTNDPVCPANANDMGFGVRDDYGLQFVGNSAMFEGTGKPQWYVRDFERKALRLVPIPDITDTLELQCETTLSLPQEQGMPLPFSDTDDLRLLLQYMLWQAYMKHDAETEDLVRAKFHQDQYESGVEDRASELRKYRRKPSVMRMNW